jgi:3-phenylpropionate/cinnamic acid dioxygenase small subunit
VSDLGEITALVHSYALLLDDGDMDAVAALFEHATWRSEPAGQVLRGVEQIRPVYEQLKTEEGSPRTKHLLTNLTVDVEAGASTASAHCYWTVLQNIEDGRAIEIMLSGQYTDRFEKIDGVWRFADRLITVDLAGDPTGHVN